jgi:hypothetical protein
MNTNQKKRQNNNYFNPALALESQETNICWG